MKHNVKSFLASAIPAIIAVILATHVELITFLRLDQENDEVMGVGHFSLKKRMHDRSITDAEVWQYEAKMRNPMHNDANSANLMNHLKSSPKAEELRIFRDSKRRLYEELAASSTHDQSDVKSKSTMDDSKVQVPEDVKNAVQLESWRTSTKLTKDNINKIIEDVKLERNGALSIAAKYADAVKKGNYAVILDNEGDDLAYLWMTLEDGHIPKVIITYGGYPDLRFQAVQEFVTAICEKLEIAPDERPKVYRGFANPYPPGKQRAAYDEVEGLGYIEKSYRQELIEKSKVLENELKEDENWMDHPEFAEGITALGKLIDDSEYTAISVLTCPAAVAHVINQKAARAKKIGVTMSSPWAYSNGEHGVRYESTFNSNRQITAMNKLLQTQVDFLGVGGGTAKTKGMRTIHDAKHGNGAGGSKIYAEKGLQNLEKVVSTSSDTRFLKIMAHAGENVANSKWKDWDLDFRQLWAYLNIQEPEHRGAATLRYLLRYLGSAVADTPHSSNSPRALTWSGDKMMSLFKLWVVWKNPVEWQAPSADLHAVITTSKDYIKGITGAARYTTGEIPSQRGPELVSFVKPNAREKNVHYSISDMNFYLVINRFQEIVNKYAA
ncbi:uncharacterized protein MELLADRAFT_95390 [Melampsora larici-populina 98AG31]|uniref:Uncharacterized protein n=1 Tax=Melampsora larici-populina (strain 98AG31 / pathotype 3-4-7) TaxID=747676 RepID=F4S951_MELLP|nr:uncharacterized protein MELLADRAFT_95390 [Melampsora larici-populina 98AG31]EGF98758.1 hypothetical protein MELLADRAFT_95390 [Melampsora larici-populina 98AG31]